MFSAVEINSGQVLANKSYEYCTISLDIIHMYLPFSFSISTKYNGQSRVRNSYFLALLLIDQQGP